MKRIVVMVSLLALSGFAVGLSMAGPEVETPVESVEPVKAEEQAELACQAFDVFESVIPRFPPTPNYCGDPCDTPGQEVGCIDTSGPVWRRVICYCSGGYLTC